MSIGATGMQLTPQPYPLWLAQVFDDEIQTGRIIAWVVGDLSASNPGADAVAQPIVTFVDDNGYVWATMAASRTAPRFICDSRGEAMEVARTWITKNGRVTKTV
jgi:hypothetical protein